MKLEHREALSCPNCLPFPAALERLFGSKERAAFVLSKMPPFCPESVRMEAEKGGRQKFTIDLGKRVTGVIGGVPEGGDARLEGMSLSKGPQLNGEMDFQRGVLKFDKDARNWINLTGVRFGKNKKGEESIRIGMSGIPFYSEYESRFEKFKRTAQNLSWKVEK